MLDPGAFAGSQVYGERVEALLQAMLDDTGTRVPGARRYALQAEAQDHGIAIPEAQLAELLSLAGEEVKA